nr:CoB--CoM heterodisulfide reductase iron-sulfur subunit B family protein [Candidatus Sigynarchaeota archaeon]
MEKTLFLGCTIPGRIPFVEKSAKVVCDDLGIKTEVLGGFACCPDPVGINSLDKNTWLALAGRNLCVAEAAGKPVMTLCTGCAMTLKTANHDLKHSHHDKEKVNIALKSVNKEFKGSLDNIKHIAQVLFEEVGVDKIKAAVKKPLKGLKVAVHLGCHFLRPSEVIKFDDPFNPTKIDEIVKATGAEPVNYTEKVLCCGHGVSNENIDIAASMNQKKFKSAKAAGAQAFVVLCPSCYLRFENANRDVKKKFNEDYNFPVLYLTDLLALAMGHGGDEIGIKDHRPSPNKVFEALGIQI